MRAMLFCTSLGFLVLAGGISVQGSAFADTDCVALAKALAPNGAFSLRLSSGQTKSFSSSKAWFCSSEFESQGTQSSMGAGLTIPINGIPIGASYNHQDASQSAQRSSFCSDSSKEFSNEQDLYILQKNGDSVIVDAVKQCITQRPTTALEVDVPNSHGNTFTVQVSTNSALGEAPVLLAADPIDNAKVLSPFSTTRIPLNGSGSMPINAVYQFQGPGDAQVKISTTIGEKIAVAKQCRTGAAGNFIVKQNVDHTSQVAMPDLDDRHPVNGNASCHPRCGNGQGDPVNYMISPTPDVTFSNPLEAHVTSGPGGLEDIKPALQPNGTIKVTGLHRTSPTVWQVKAKQTKTVTTTSLDQVGDAAPIQYGEQFSVKMDQGKGGVLIIMPAQGSPVTFTEADLTGNNLSDGIALVGTPSLSSTGIVYQLVQKEPGC